MLIKLTGTDGKEFYLSAWSIDKIYLGKDGLITYAGGYMCTEPPADVAKAVNIARQMGIPPFQHVKEVASSDSTGLDSGLYAMIPGMIIGAALASS